MGYTPVNGLPHLFLVIAESLKNAEMIVETTGV
jgi:hypothetical protein